MKSSNLGYSTLFAIFLLFCGASHAFENNPIYGVVVPDVAVQFDGQSKLRFCERTNIKGVVCGFEQKLFGKTKFAARDWWSPESYIQASTGRSNFTVVGVEQTEDGRGLKIFFQVN